jgi:hypothetical protein
LARVLGPSIVSALFAVSMDKHVWGGNLWSVDISISRFFHCYADACYPLISRWIVMSIVCSVSAVVGLLVKEKVPTYTQMAASGLDEVEEAECYEFQSTRRKKCEHSSDEESEVEEWR